MSTEIKIGIIGAGAVGCYMGGRLIQSGADVILVGRERLAREVAAHGLNLSDYEGVKPRIKPEDVRYETDPAALADRDWIFVTVKSQHSTETARSMAPHITKARGVISFQNGVGNPRRLRDGGITGTVLTGMVPFNILREDGARFHLGTSGKLTIHKADAGEEEPAQALTRAGFDVDLNPRAPDIAWSKLLVNLNNAVNALSGVPLREELSNRGYRRVLAMAMEEALLVLKAAGIKPPRYGRMIPSLGPRILRLPNWLFFRVASAMVKIDPRARSSMWEDLERGRLTEIDFINGEIPRLAEEVGARAPVNAQIVEMIKTAEREGGGSPRLSPERLLERISNFQGGSA